MAGKFKPGDFVFQIGTSRKLKVNHCLPNDWYSLTCDRGKAWVLNEADLVLPYVDYGQLEQRVVADAVKQQQAPACAHKWVNYQPLVGEAYECCALAGCGITKAAYEASQPKEDKTEDFWIVDESQSLGSPMYYPRLGVRR